MPLQMQIIVVGRDDTFDFKNVNEGDSKGDSDDEPGLPGVTIYSDLNFNGADEKMTFLDEYTSHEPTAAGDGNPSDDATAIGCYIDIFGGCI